MIGWFDTELPILPLRLKVEYIFVLFNIMYMGENSLNRPNGTFDFKDMQWLNQKGVLGNFPIYVKC